MLKAMLAAAVSLCAVAAALAVVMAVGLHQLKNEEVAAVAPVQPQVAPVAPKPATQPINPPLPTTLATTGPAVKPLEPIKKPKEISAAAPVPKPIAPAKPAEPPRSRIVENSLAKLQAILLDPATPVEQRQAVIVELARSEAGAAVLLRLTEEGRLSSALQGLAVERLYQNAAALAGGVTLSP